uniref:Uncharacterized protein n=1 Tax=Leersia perrieri TaxID=77586 RepID=A0A0D9VWM0_9ORYZ
MQAGGGAGGGDGVDTRGRHRIQAELKKLEQEARFLEFWMKRMRKKPQDLPVSLGTDGLKVHKICADANAGSYDSYQAAPRGNVCCKL